MAFGTAPVAGIIGSINVMKLGVTLGSRRDHAADQADASSVDRKGRHVGREHRMRVVLVRCGSSLARGLCSCSSVCSNT